MPIQAVLFDLDGTLLDRRETFRLHLERHLERHRDLFEPAESARYVRRLLELDENGTLDRDQFHVRAEAEFALPPGSSQTLKDDFERHFPETCVPLPNLVGTLRALRAQGYGLGLITNGRELIQRRKIDRLGVRHYFDTLLISEAVGVRKPGPQIFHMALEELRVEPGNALHVGDHPEADVWGAKRSGLVAVWRQDSFWEEPPDADYVIDDLAALPQIVADAK